MLLSTTCSVHGWGGRMRTYDRGSKVRCLTAWPRPTAERFYGLAKEVVNSRSLIAVDEAMVLNEHLHSGRRSDKRRGVEAHASESRQRRGESHSGVTGQDSRAHDA